MKLIKQKKITPFLLIAVLTSLLTLVLIVYTFFIGFNHDKNSLNQYLIAQLEKNYGVCVTDIYESARIKKGNCEALIYQFTSDKSQNGYFAVSLLKSPIIEKYKVKSFFVLSKDKGENDSTVLLCEGYIKAYAFHIKDNTLYFSDEHNRISWGFMIVMGIIVFSTSILGMVHKQRQEKPGE